LRNFVSNAEVLMNVHVSYRIHKNPALEKDIQHQIEKLRKRLQVFRPELIHLKGSVEENSPREGVTVSLNLRLPSGQMAVQTSAPTGVAAVKSAFEDLLHQLTRHKDLLRTSGWKRRRSEIAEGRERQVPFEQTVAAVHPPTVSAEDVRSYVNVNLSRLERFVEREIYMREAQDLIVSDSLSKEEVIDEAIAAALGNGNNEEKPERLSLEPWLYSLALRALDDLSRPDESNGHAVPLEDSVRPRNVRASDESELQFHQPDESITGATVIPDDRIATPEQIMASDETLRVIASALRDIRPRARQAFILYAVEGFAIDEISAITGLAPEVVLASISAARDHLRQAPGLARSSPGKFIPSGVA
jgi:RNA polymerase sigma factor (sigma-70 family)